MTLEHGLVAPTGCSDGCRHSEVKSSPHLQMKEFELGGVRAGWIGEGFFSKDGLC